MIGDLFLQNDRERLLHKFATVPDGKGFCKTNDMTIGRVVGNGFHVAIIGSGLFDKKLLGGIVVRIC
jgi:hypothetical protein